MAIKTAEDYNEVCMICGEEKPLNEIAIITPSDPAMYDQCHPFMEMDIACIDCEDKYAEQKGESHENDDSYIGGGHTADKYTN